ncbi:MAG: family 10 glycosylhydrolase [Verrucomicrobiota bacterium]|nr:family 10 glycosylhydrolase [Verrucomicrobiota bacterium]
MPRSFLALLLLCCATVFASTNNQPPPIQREFRGSWIATFKNINWPSAPGLAVSEQKAELLRILDKAVELKLNVVILQVRPACDALYDSPFEPWSEHLSGKMGIAPQPYYDPLKFAVEEAHARGLELHAWFNPFRAALLPKKNGFSKKHISVKEPSLVKKYGSHLWLDPGMKAAQEHSLRVILDVVKRYDIDGVHLDDYFYPYKEPNGTGGQIDFPDYQSFKAYKNSGGKLERADWRRRNVNQFVERLSRDIKKTKSWVKFGISPFGIWRPGYPEQIRGLDAYDQLYADAKLWLNKGWADYFVPQLYWSIDKPAQSYPVLLDWWLKENQRQRHVWPGNDLTKFGSAWQADEVLGQIELSRKASSTPGHVLYHIGSLERNKNGLADLLRTNVYSEVALPPAWPWIDGKPPVKPLMTNSASLTNGLFLKWANPAGAEKVWVWVVQSRYGKSWRTEIYPGRVTGLQFPAAQMPEAVHLTAVDRCANLSPSVTWPFPAKAAASVSAGETDLAQGSKRSR